MTQFYLCFSPEKDYYFIRSIGMYRMPTTIIYREGQSDEDFKAKAEKYFDNYIEREQVLKEAFIVKSAFIF